MPADNVVDPVIRKKGDKTVPGTVHAVASGFHDFRLYAFEGVDVFVHDRPPAKFSNPNTII